MFGQLRARSATKKATASALSGLHARITEIAERESVTRDLVERFEAESAVARDAVKAAGRAREQRDEYRRVLAAAITNERRSEMRIEELDAERRAAHEGARDEARHAGAAAAERDALHRRVTELEAELSTRVSSHEASMQELRDRAWVEREGAREEFVKALVQSRAQAADESQLIAARIDETLQGRVAEAVAAGIQRALGEHPKGAAERIVDMRRRLLVGLGALAAVCGIALTPAAVLSAVDAERAYFVHMITNTTPWHLLFGAAAAFGLSILLFTLAYRDARSGAGDPTAGQPRPNEMPRGDDLENDGEDHELVPFEAPDPQGSVSNVSSQEPRPDPRPLTSG